MTVQADHRSPYCGYLCAMTTSEDLVRTRLRHGYAEVGAGHLSVEP